MAHLDSSILNRWSRIVLANGPLRVYTNVRQCLFSHSLNSSTPRFSRDLHLNNTPMSLYINLCHRETAHPALTQCTPPSIARCPYHHHIRRRTRSSLGKGKTERFLLLHSDTGKLYLVVLI